MMNPVYNVTQRVHKRYQYKRPFLLWLWGLWGPNSVVVVVYMDALGKDSYWGLARRTHLASSQPWSHLLISGAGQGPLSSTAPLLTVQMMADRAWCLVLTVAFLQGGVFSIISSFKDLCNSERPLASDRPKVYGKHMTWV